MNMWLSIFPLIVNKPINDIDILRKWADENRVDEKKIIFLYRTIKSAIEKLNQKGYNIVENPYDTNDIIYQMIPILRKVYHKKEFTRVRDLYVRNEHKYVLGKYQQVNNYNELNPDILLSFYETSVAERTTIVFSVNVDISDKRMFTLDVTSSSGLKIRIPKRAHRPDFVGKTEIVNIKYPPIDYEKLSHGIGLQSEIPEQNIIE